MLTATARSQLERIFTDSVRAVDPALLIHRTIAVDRSTLSIHTPTQKERVPLGARVYVIGAGKGAAQMARALSAVLGEHLTDGVIVVPDNHTAPIDRVAIMKGEHPLHIPQFESHPLNFET